jgi:hypothetical protein
MTKSERKTVADYILAHPEYTYPAIARLTGLAYSTITRIAGEFEIRRPVGKRSVFTIPNQNDSEAR